MNRADYDVTNTVQVSSVAAVRRAVEACLADSDPSELGAPGTGGKFMDGLNSVAVGKGGDLRVGMVDLFGGQKRLFQLLRRRDRRARPCRRR